MKEEFKAFVRTKPELISYVTKGDMTWQKFYELWSLYGADNSIWDKYKVVEEATKASDTFNFSSLIDSLKNVDMNSVQKGINSMQKAVELLQGLSAKDNNMGASYKPRQLFKKFED